jgi:hypothetical protein
MNKSRYVSCVVFKIDDLGIYLLLIVYKSSSIRIINEKDIIHPIVFKFINLIIWATNYLC